MKTGHYYTEQKHREREGIFHLDNSLSLMHLLRRSCFRASDVFLLVLPLSVCVCVVFLSARLVSRSIGTDRRREAQPGVIVIATVLRDTYQTPLSSPLLFSTFFFSSQEENL